MNSTSKNTEKQLVNQEILSLYPIGTKPVELRYSGETVSNDGGLLLLKEAENLIDRIKDISDCITDTRDLRYNNHTLESILSQRIYQIAAGYEDAIDCNDLRKDPILKICSNSLPDNDLDLGSQPTMSRFENSVSRSDLYRGLKSLTQGNALGYQWLPTSCFFGGAISLPRQNRKRQ